LGIAKPLPPPDMVGHHAPRRDAMNADERQLITQLFERMRNYGAPEKDREADALINQLVRANPDAVYMLVQSVLGQDQALEATNARVQELEEQVRSMEEGDRSRGARSGGFLSGYWGGRQEPRSSVPQVGSRATPTAYGSREEARAPWSQSSPPPQAPPAQPAASGGFMRSALATAAGVAGGVLVADSLRNMLGGGAHAGPRHDSDSSEEETYVDDRDNDPGTEQAAYEDDGNDPAFDSGDDGGEIDV
jgi:uncharacterized protein